MIREQPTLLLMAWHTSLNQSNWPISILSQGILAAAFDASYPHLR